MTAACLAWIGGISLAAYFLLDLSKIIGWTIVSTLGVLSIVASSVLLFELRHALDLTVIVNPPNSGKRTGARTEALAFGFASPL